MALFLSTSPFLLQFSHEALTVEGLRALSMFVTLVAGQRAVADVTSGASVLGKLGQTKPANLLVNNVFFLLGRSA